MKIQVTRETSCYLFSNLSVVSLMHNTKYLEELIIDNYAERNIPGCMFASIVIRVKKVLEKIQIGDRNSHFV